MHRCITVTGTVISTSPEKDGDVHIKVKLDSHYRHVLNHFNYTEQDGNLVVEPICVKTPEPDQHQAKMACGKFRQHIGKLKVRTRVSITGALVTDTRVKIGRDWTHGWREIHPVTTIRPSR
ncbi:MAG TPA: hypothetical protein VK582_07620 [Pyrinomonadaceae bacterium]|nr:hypothetical protein [Pyrinomonadaceae bacterium]